MKLIVLDRDGVINEDRGEPVVSTDDWQPIAGSLEAIARLTQAGWQVAIATNQSGIAQGLLDVETLHAIHRKMHDMVNQAGGRIDVVAFCPHSDADGCDCRKPAPGMLYTIGERLDVELSQVVLVGDSLRDMQAAMAAAAQPIMVRTGKGQATLDNNKGLEHIPAFDDLSSCVDHLLTPEESEE
ncbi:MAG: D-glycero-beta-D-manno-heptose 1,7-bisphosphate 7-phosphatase [Granulosicoccus sp.]